MTRPRKFGKGAGRVFSSHEIEPERVAALLRLAGQLAVKPRASVFENAAKLSSKEWSFVVQNIWNPKRRAAISRRVNEAARRREEEK
jgi:hypothetical protein